MFVASIEIVRKLMAVSYTRATPQNFQFSIKVPETITHLKRLDVNKDAITAFEEYLDKIWPLRTTKKLGAILFQLPPSFAVNDFKNILDNKTAVFTMCCFH
jgi:uncharacterized protein YecE (DUF72 family)